MAHYLIGDLQGCDEPLQRLLDTIRFSPSRDTLYVLGDLVNRGPASASVLRRLAGYGDAARCLLGNHDLNLLAIGGGVRTPHRKDTVGELLETSDREPLLEWLRHRPLAFEAQGILMVHAGVLPAWDGAQVLRLAAEIEALLRSPQEQRGLLEQMYGNEPVRWEESLTGAPRWRVIVNALTRLRFCTPDGEMDLKASGGPASAPSGMLPWFDVPGRRTSGLTVAFGHWSTLGFLQRPDLISLDTGCVWGGCLSALRLGDRPGGHELIQVQCEQAQAPGD